MLEMLNVPFFGSCSWSGPLIFLIALCLPQNNFLQEKSEGNFSSIYLLLDNYFIDLSTLKEINIHAILDESNKLGIQQSKSENQIIALAQNDQKNNNKKKIVTKNARKRHFHRHRWEIDFHI